MARPRGRDRGGRSRGNGLSRGGRGGQRLGRKEARGKNNAFESARIVEDEEEYVVCSSCISLCILI